MLRISASHKLLAVILATPTGASKAIVSEIETGKQVECIEGACGIEWFNDDCTVLYTTSDDALRPSQVWKRTFGTEGSDLLLHDEPLEECFLSLTKTKDGQKMLINSNSKLSSEVFMMDASNPQSQLQLIQARMHGLQYHVEHHQGHLIILTNARGAVNYCVMAASEARPELSYWRVLVPERTGVALEDLDVFEDCLLLWERHAGLPGYSIMHTGSQDASSGWADRKESDQPRALATTLLWPAFGMTHVRQGMNADPAATTATFYGSSPILHEQAARIDLKTTGASLVHRSRRRPPYRCWQEWATSVDGTEVPLTVTAAEKGAPRQPRPCLLEVYGAYGESLETAFHPSKRLLLECGWVLASAHVRGGGELGHRWRHAGRKAGRRLAIQDALASLAHLEAAGWIAPGLVALKAHSAGGVLAAHLLLSRPEAFCAAILRMPFLDLFGSMMDPDAALTVHEWDEWGDPREPGGTDLLKELCPYQAIQRFQPGPSFPSVLATVGLLDDRVPAYMPTKWVVALRRRLGPDARLFLNPLDAGHFLSETEEAELDALEVAFVLEECRRRQSQYL